MQSIKNKEIENRIKDSIPFDPNRTFDKYKLIFLNELNRNHFKIIKAFYDLDGNCSYCGEAGRCAGFHIHEN